MTEEEVNTTKTKKLISLGALSVLPIALAGCGSAAQTPAMTVTATLLVSHDKAKELATNECRKGHLVLGDSTTSAEATLMTLGEADAAAKSADEITNYGVPARTKVWLVQLTGIFQIIGRPPGANGASPTAIPP